jgi:hypothetical protein
LEVVAGDSVVVGGEDVGLLMVVVMSMIQLKNKIWCGHLE